MDKTMLVKVRVINSDGTLYREYTMNHDDHAERRVLGMQCGNAFEVGQGITTYPVKEKSHE